MNFYYNQIFFNFISVILCTVHFLYRRINFFKSLLFSCFVELHLFHRTGMLTILLQIFRNMKLIRPWESEDQRM